MVRFQVRGSSVTPPCPFFHPQYWIPTPTLRIGFTTPRPPAPPPPPPPLRPANLKSATTPSETKKSPNLPSHSNAKSELVDARAFSTPMTSSPSLLLW